MGVVQHWHLKTFCFYLSMYIIIYKLYENGNCQTINFSFEYDKKMTQKNAQSFREKNKWSYERNKNKFTRSSNTFNYEQKKKKSQPIQQLFLETMHIIEISFFCFLFIVFCVRLFLLIFDHVLTTFRSVYLLYLTDAVIMLCVMFSTKIELYVLLRFVWNTETYIYSIKLVHRK